MSKPKSLAAARANRNDPIFKAERRQADGIVLEIKVGRSQALCQARSSHQRSHARVGGRYVAIR